MNPLVNIITVRQQKKHREFVFISDTLQEAQQAFNEVSSLFDGIHYNHSPFIMDTYGNKLAKLVSVRDRDIIAELSNKILGTFFDISVLIFLSSYFLVFIGVCIA